MYWGVPYFTDRERIKLDPKDRPSPERVALTCSLRSNTRKIPPVKRMPRTRAPRTEQQQLKYEQNRLHGNRYRKKMTKLYIEDLKASIRECDNEFRMERLQELLTQQTNRLATLNREPVGELKGRHGKKKPPTYSKEKTCPVSRQEEIS